MSDALIVWQPFSFSSLSRDLFSQGAEEGC
jgi:hypothetical protein